MSETAMEVVIPCDDLNETTGFFSQKLGFRMDGIFPADDPRVAVMSGHGLNIRIERDAEIDPGILRLLSADPDALLNGERKLVAPNGTLIEIDHIHPQLEMPETRTAFMVRRLADNAPWVIGRAGMHYRDLVPDRLGGSIIASHIRIPEGGPVPDVVHYHTVGFQMIYCYKGWVRLVYEDQGEPFILAAGDCVLQPPQIRHRVLEASKGLEVIEVGCPAEHMTSIEHDMDLPNGTINPDRDFGGQKFIRHQKEHATLSNWRLPGFEVRDTGIGEATGGIASARVVTSSGTTQSRSHHDSDIHFTFVLEGSLTISNVESERFDLVAGDAFVTPPDYQHGFHERSGDLELLEVSLPAEFKTVVT